MTTAHGGTLPTSPCKGDLAPSYMISYVLGTP
jgi:hypothetical protein